MHIAKKNPFKTIIALAAVLMLLVWGGTALTASGDYEPDTGFEVDGNIAFNDLGGDLDWWDGQANTPDYPPAILIEDVHSKNDPDDYFSPSGKFDKPEEWSVKLGSVGPGQNELTNIFVYAIAPGDLGDTPSKPVDTWLILGMERVKKSGTFALDFELNQEPWEVGPLPHVGGPVRTSGDIAVGFELKGNPTDAQTDLQVLIVQYMPTDIYKCDLTSWPGQGNDPGEITVGTEACPAYGDSGWYYRFLADASILSSSGLGTATMNAQGEGFTQLPFTPNGETYTSYDPQGNQDDYVGEFEFAEAAINLTALGLSPGCPGFGSVHAKTRSSLEVGADLKDLSGPRPLPVECYIEGYKYLDVDGSGDWGDNPPEVALSGWQIFIDEDNEGDLDWIDANGNGVWDSGEGERWTLTDENGYYLFANIADGDYRVAEVCLVATPPWVQTEPVPSPLGSCGTGVYDFTINIDNKVERGDFGNGRPAIDVTKSCPTVVEVGQSVDYTFTVTNIGTVNLENVNVSDPTANLNETVGSLGPGDYDDTLASSITASEIPAGGVITNTVTASGNFGDSTVFATVQDTDICTTAVVDARISITPDDVNEVGEPHTFTVYAEKNESGSWVAADDGTIVTVSLTDANGAVSSVSSNTCTSGTSAGYCSVTFTSASPGTVTGHASATIIAGGLGLFRETNGTGGNSSDAVKTFVDSYITIAPDDTNEVGDSHTFTVTVMENDGSGFVAAAGEAVTVTLTDANGAAAVKTGDTCAATDASGQCTVTFYSNTAGTVTGHASSNVQVGGLSLARATDGSGNNSGDAVKTFVDAYITIAPDDTNGIGEDHTFTVTVMENDGSGFVAAAGEAVTVTLTDANGAAAVKTGDTCAATDASGQCTVTFYSNTAGTVTGHASSNVQVGGLSLARATDGSSNNSGDAVKTFIDGSLAWLKHDDRGNLVGGATFLVCRTHSYDSETDTFTLLGSPDCVTVLDNSPPDNDPDDGEFLLEGLFLGKYSIEETVPPPGMSGDSHIEYPQLTLADPDVTVEYIWINTTEQGCTPGFWQGGSGSKLWNKCPNDDPNWGGEGISPFCHTTEFNLFFNSVTDSQLNGLSMWDLVSTGGGSNWAVKAARDMVAAYLNESWFPDGYPASSLGELESMWYAAVTGGDAGLSAFHTIVGGWNAPEPPGYCPPGLPR